MRRMIFLKYGFWIAMTLLLLALGFMAGASLRGQAQAKSERINDVQSPADKATPAVNSSSALITTLFSPQDNIQKTLVNTINNAKRNILVQAYLMTDERVINALIAAHRRGVDVVVLLDGRMAADGKTNVAARLSEAGILVRLETQYDNAHNKIMIFDHDSDQATVITGSYNYTYSAQKRNAENVVIIRQSPATIQRYVENWQHHAQQALPYAENLAA